MGGPDVWSEVFPVLCHPVRRRLLLSLYEVEETETELDARAVGYESPTTNQQEISLQHVHLPKLQHHGYVSSASDFHVSRGAQWDEIAPVIQVLIENEEELPAELR